MDNHVALVLFILLILRCSYLHFMDEMNRPIFHLSIKGEDEDILEDVDSALHLNRAYLFLVG